MRYIYCKNMFVPVHLTTGTPMSFSEISEGCKYLDINIDSHCIQTSALKKMVTVPITITI